MSIQRLRNLWRRDAEAIQSKIAHPRFATVENLDPANHAVRLRLQPSGILSGWVPDASAFATGGGFGVVAPLTQGDQVLVVYAHGDSGNPVITGRLFSSIDMPPVSTVTGKAVQPGEIGLFAAGAWVHVTGGVIHAQATSFNFKGDLNLDGNATITGDVSVTGTKSGSTGAIAAKGQITDVNAGHGSLNDLRTAHDNHTHGNVQNGGGHTSAPNLTT